MSTADRVYADVQRERAKQDEHWGGPEHDDTLHPFDWLTCIEHQGEAATEAWGRERKAEVRERFVKIAALAVAALESMDRRSPPFEHKCSVCGGCRISIYCCFTTCSCEDGP